MTARQTIRLQTHPWVDPVLVAAGLAGRDWLLCLLSDGGDLGQWSYVAADPEVTRTVDAGTAADFTDLRALLQVEASPDLIDDAAPLFTGGVVGLASYDMGARLMVGRAGDDWPDLVLARYTAILAFDHHTRRVIALGRADTEAGAETRRAAAAAWLGLASAASTPPALATHFQPETDASAYIDAVAEVVARIAAGELFQANIARAWSGLLTPSVRPFDVFKRLAADSPAPFAAYWGLPGRALVSNSPELFLTLDAESRRLEARPIKGTRPRGTDPASDAVSIAELVASAKDRAENLMIVDLMRNDLSRVCEPGSVVADALFAVETYANVHHLVSTVSGTLGQGHDIADVLAATFPPGSITGAPKHQAMRVIADLEPPRGAWCGSLIVADGRGGVTASVLIRTVSFVRDEAGWRWRTLAGAGVVADSNPHAELAETETKIAAIRRALVG